MTSYLIVQLNGNCNYRLIACHIASVSSNYDVTTRG